MNIIYLLIPIALMLVGLGIAAFLWAVKSGQFEDLEGPAHRILFDDDDGDVAQQDPGRKPKQEPDEPDKPDA